MQILFKNVASQYVVLLVTNSSTGLPVTGDAANITGYLAKDTGSNTALNTPNPTEVGNGLYRFTLTQAETNADLLQFSATSVTSTSRINPLVMATSAAVPNVNVIQISGDSVAADNAEAFFDGNGYAGTNNVIPTITNVTNSVTADVTKWNGTAVATPDTAGHPKVTIKSGTGTGEISLTSGVPVANITQINGSSTIDSLTPAELAKIILAFVAGKASGGGSTPVIFRNVGDSKDRITMTVDSSGNRTTVVLDAS